MADFKLSASLQGHEDDVRAVAFPNPSLVLSSSRDATVRAWKLLSSTPPTFDGTISSHGTAFVNSVAYVPPSSRYTDGLIASGGQDAIIDVRPPGRPPQDNGEALLLGHAGNVCALDVSDDGRMMVSGSWDCEARVWEVGKWEAAAVLQGHQGGVWAVLAYDRETVMTGCADKKIRIFNTSGKLLRSTVGGGDVVRSLCKLPKDHSSGAHFASTGNDGIIRLWTIEGREVAQLRGHDSFVYTVVALPTGELASSGEDRTVRVWKGTQCIQTITHPAITVWTVAACSENGDIVTGASDRIVRVFSRSPDRQADTKTTAAFEESVKASSIPQQQMPQVNKEKLPGPEFIQQKSGTKDGQVQMIKETNGNVTAYSWSSAAQQWTLVGTVVDSAGSSGVKTSFKGQDYDYVFDVDIDDDKPPLKLPYNLSQNPYEAAQKFIADEELPISYLDQVANFIVTNTQGATLGQQQTQAPGSDPWGTEARYRPGDAGAPSTANAPPDMPKPPKMLPQTQYLTITTANLRTIHKKIQEVNQQLIEKGSKDVSLNPDDLDVLAATIKQLEQTNSQPDTSKTVLKEGIDLAVRISTSWPPEYRLPGLDILRLLAAASTTTVSATSSGSGTLVDILAASGVFSTDVPVNNTMLAIRTLANLFNTEEGRLVVDGEFEKIHDLIVPFVPKPGSAGASGNKNLTIAITTLYINFSVLLSAPSSNADRALTLLDDLTSIINAVTDSEALYRALVGAGTLLSLGEDFRTASKEVFDIEKALQRAEGVGKEPRIKRIIGEIRDELK